MTYDPVGYMEFVFTGKPIALGDAAAVVSAEVGGTPVDGCAPQGTYLDFHYCYAAPGDFGGAALVDGRTGNLAFAGGITWMGTGALYFPTPLDPASDLTAIAKAPAIAPTTYEYHLQGLATDDVGDTALETVRDMDHVVNWVGWGTYDALVYLHPYSTGAYDPAAADLIVILVLL